MAKASVKICSSVKDYGLHVDNLENREIAVAS